ncbi:hypothetical protein [Cellulomonas sp. NPDC089187]|uniref:hypothetical protein n=1 Tax=Cellulomonas sp. NPDC089187 TaxID=3154970 RepID=UPI00341D0BF3
MGYQWIATELRTGRIICDLPSFAVPSVSVRLCDYSTANGTLPVTQAPAEWERATAPLGSALVLLDDDGDPVWGGLVLKRIRSADDQVTITLATMETYLGRRYLGTLSYTAREQCALAADLVTRSVLDGSIALRVQTRPGHTTRTRSWTHDSDTTALDALDDLASAAGGPEFTVRWDRETEADGTLRYVPVLELADRIGSAAGAQPPAAVLDLPGALSDLQMVEDWAEGKGANRVIATGKSATSGGTRPESTPQVHDDPDRPTVEHRWSPGSATSTAVLNEAAAGALTVLRDGAQSLALTARADRPPLLGTDWALGDDIGYHVDPGVPSFPRGLDGVARCIGWTLDLDPAAPTVVPVLADTEALITIEED